MKKQTNHRRRPEMLAEYDFTGAQRGKYARRYRKGTNVVVLDPDVSRAFPTAESVNEALRELSKIAQRQTSSGSR